MSSDDKILAESIRSGKYFEDSRQWFRAMYIGPVSERTFFLVIAVLSGLVGLTSIAALVSLMPLKETKPVMLYMGDRADQTTTILKSLKSSGARLNPAMMEFYVTQYVRMRESYFVSTYLSNARFVRQQSNDAVYESYISKNDVSNPESPAAQLGQYGQRIPTIKSVDVDDTKAEVDFVIEQAGVGIENKTRWTARIEFVYTGMEVGEQKNAETGVLELTTTDPKFQVVKYELEQK